MKSAGMCVHVYGFIKLLRFFVLQINRNFNLTGLCFWWKFSVKLHSHQSRLSFLLVVAVVYLDFCLDKRKKRFFFFALLRQHVIQCKSQISFLAIDDVSGILLARERFAFSEWWKRSCGNAAGVVTLLERRGGESLYRCFVQQIRIICLPQRAWCFPCVSCMCLSSFCARVSCTRLSLRKKPCVEPGD